MEFKLEITAITLPIIRTGIFIPDMAFEAIVKREIEKLKEPSMKCVDLVVGELIKLIHHCTEKMQNYPRLREEIERLTSQKIRLEEVSAKDQIIELIDMQLAYINTNHADFQRDANGDRKTADGERNKLGNQIIREGWLTLQNVTILRGGSKDLYFILTSDSLSWFKDDEKTEKKFDMKLEGLKLKDISGGFMSKKCSFALFNPNQKNVYKDYKQLELVAENQEMLDAWKASFLRAGVYPTKDETEPSGDEKTDSVNIQGDPQLERQVETIRNLVESYMKIVSKSHRDLVPKTIMCIIIDEVKAFLKQEMLANMYSLDMNTLMEESEDEKDRRENLLRSHQALKDALDIINEVSSKTVSVPVPSAVNDDWRQPDPSVDLSARRPPPPPPNMNKPKPINKGLPPPIMPQRVQSYNPTVPARPISGVSSTIPKPYGKP